MRETDSTEAEGSKAPSSSEEGVGGGGTSRTVLLKRAAQMRNNLTEPEKRLWKQLRYSRLGGHKFRRQAVIGNRIADFFCPAKGLVVEIDGETHDRALDSRRDHRLHQKQGFRTIRFTNEDVMRNMEGVLAAIDEALRRQPDRWPEQGRHHPPAPSTEEEGV